jgi:hypothetical protein
MWYRGNPVAETIFEEFKSAQLNSGYGRRRRRGRNPPWGLSSFCPLALVLALFIILQMTAIYHGDKTTGNVAILNDIN